MSDNTDDVEIIHTNDFELAKKLVEQGFEAIECAFGSFGSVMGELLMDHHGKESWREGVALRACRDHYGDRKNDPRFVVTGTADADAVLAIVALSALVPKEQIPTDFYELVNHHDIDPIGLDLLDQAFGEELLAFQQIQHQRRNVESFHKAIKVLIKILNEGLSKREKKRLRQREERRIQLAEGCFQELMSPDVLLVYGQVWGFDRWYRRAPIVVSYSDRHGSVSVGCRDQSVAMKYFGEKGLFHLFSRLGEGWGGRSTIGGSPRGKHLPFEASRNAAEEVVALVAEFKEKMPLVEEAVEEAL